MSSARFLRSSPAESLPDCEKVGGGEARFLVACVDIYSGAMPTTYNIALIPGDGIGDEVVAEARKSLDAAADRFGLAFETTEYDLGAKRYNATGETLPDSVLEEIRGHDAILLGAVGHPSVPPGVLERGLLLRARFELDHHVNLRPVKLYEGVSTPLAGKSPQDIDFIVCREGTEGPYAGAGGVLRRGTVHEMATEESLNTYHGISRIVADAFARAELRPRRKVTMVHKTNVLVHAGDLWARTFEAEAAKHPDVQTEYLHVDAAAMFFLTQPERFDVVVTDNLFGDILTDIGAAICGGIGLAASGNLDPSRANPSMFEPVHGSAPDIAGQQKADPTAAVLSVAMMLDHLGETGAAEAVEEAVAADLAGRGDAVRSTSTIGDALALSVAG
jgi:3-isopropylmalate dehydrogenase